MQPEIFRQMRADLASMWTSRNKTGNLRRISTKASLHEPLNEEKFTSVCVDSMAIDEDAICLRVGISVRSFVCCISFSFVHVMYSLFFSFQFTISSLYHVHLD